MNRQNWKEINGDETLALDWPLNEDSHIWEIGGYEGRWAQQIWDKFQCNITIFEPQLWAVEKLMLRFKDIPNTKNGKPKIEIRPHGLWSENSILPIGNFHTDGASLIHDDGREAKQYGAFKNFYYEIRDFHDEISLVLMNIEGGEWQLLPNMITSGMIERFSNFWCQFHPADGQNPEFEWICRGMERHGFEMIWDCYPTAVAWRKKHG